jgi:hypothetical protein
MDAAEAAQLREAMVEQAAAARKGGRVIGVVVLLVVLGVLAASAVFAIGIFNTTTKAVDAATSQITVPGGQPAVAGANSAAAAAQQAAEQVKKALATIPVTGPRAHLALHGAATFDQTGAIGSDCTELGDGSQTLRLPQDDGTAWTILAAPPATAKGPGSFPIGGSSKAFISVNHIVNGQAATWGSLLKPTAKGTITRSGTSFTATFTGLVANGGGATGTLDGVLEMTCG